MKKIGFLFFTILIISTGSCKKDTPNNETKKSDKKELLSFYFKEQLDSAAIDKVNHTVTIFVSNSTNLKKLSPTIMISEGATIKPNSKDSVDFSGNPIIYTVTAEDNSIQTWKIIVNIIIIPKLYKKSVSSIVVDNSNIMWIGTDSGLYKGIDTTFSKVDIAIIGAISSLSYDKSSNTLWIGSISGLFKGSIDGSTLTITTISTNKLSSSSILTTYIDSSQRNWFGTSVGFTLNYKDYWKNDTFRVNTLGHVFPMSIEGTSINSIASWDGDYYFATNTSSLYRAYNFVDSVDAFSGATQWESAENGKAISPTMYVVFVDSKGRQWMGGTNGIQAHTGHNSKTNAVVYQDELPDLNVHAVAEAPNGDIWVGTEKGIAIFNGTSWTTKTTNLANLFVTAIAFNKDGNAWIGTKKGLTLLSK